MADAPALHAGPPVRGYVSEESKRTFTITAGILCAVFFIAQFALPFMFMAVAMPVSIMSFQWLKVIDPSDCAVWQGDLWALEYTLAGVGSDGPETGVFLKRFSLDDEAKPSVAGEVNMGGAKLLADTDRLWIISPSRVAYFENGQVHFVPHTRRLGDIGRPFLYDGAPAVIEQTPNGLRIHVLKNDNWAVRHALVIDVATDTDPERVIQIIQHDGVFHLFRRYGSMLYYREGIPPIVTNAPDWENVGQIESNWVAMLLDGRPTVLYTTGPGGFSQTVHGYRRFQSEWKGFFSHVLPNTATVGAFALEQPGRFLIATQPFPGRLRFVEVKGGDVRNEWVHGRASPFPPAMMGMILIPQLGTYIMPLILALILSSMMKRHRICHHSAGQMTAPLASLARRALAQIVDAALLSAPMVAGWILMFGPMTFDFENAMSKSGPLAMLAGFGLMFLGVGWALLWVLIYSWLEGRYGRTPGKWLAGIQVLGTDLRPCGFGRALIRNLLKFVDGFFNFMVGVMIVALSENWQRVGDMAARTVVVDAPRRGGWAQQSLPSDSNTGA